MDGEAIDLRLENNKFFGWLAWVPGEEYPICLISFDIVEIVGREPVVDDRRGTRRT